MCFNIRKWVDLISSSGTDIKSDKFIVNNVVACNAKDSQDFDLKWFCSNRSHFWNFELCLKMCYVKQILPERYLRFDESCHWFQQHREDNHFQGAWQVYLQLKRSNKFVGVCQSRGCSQHFRVLVDLSLGAWKQWLESFLRWCWAKMGFYRAISLPRSAKGTAPNWYTFYFFWNFQNRGFLKHMSE